MFSFILHADFMLFQSPENMSVESTFLPTWMGILVVFYSCLDRAYNGFYFLLPYTRVYIN